VLKWIAIIAWGLHIIEAAIAWYWAKCNGLDQVRWEWGVQTFVCGGPSLLQLHRRIKKNREHMGGIDDAYRALRDSPAGMARPLVDET